MRPSTPLATYRLQLSASFGFDQAAAIVPYLKALGISHLYASPFLKARAGSLHGYDIVDYNALNPELGGEPAFRRLRDALAEADLGLILDFVPNHMAVHHADNAWWLDVLEWGPGSPHAASFDIDWNAHLLRRQGRLLLPILGTTYGEAVARREIELRYDANEGSFSAWYYDHRLPIRPLDYAEILRAVVAAGAKSGEPAGYRLRDLASKFQAQRNLDRDGAKTLKMMLRATEGGSDLIEAGLHAYRSKSPAGAEVARLHCLLERQHYRLAHWSLAQTDLNYRRFFDISSLAGLRVEDAATFEAMHRLVGRLIGGGDLEGLRLDHIDGLKEPAQYCQRLQRLIQTCRPSGSPFYMVVEKILGEGEPVPRFPGVAGTTGYEWLNVISRVLLDERGMPALDRTWHEFSGVGASFGEILIAAKHDVLDNILTSEFTALAKLLARIAAGHCATCDYSADRLRAALRLFVIHFPVYRTYLTSAGPSAEDRALIEHAIMAARTRWVGPNVEIFDFLRDALTLDLVAPGRRGHSVRRVHLFASKVQQFTGPMMAKSLEDTAFYRHHRLLAQNEVGGHPDAGGMSIADFHRRMGERATTFPFGLTATATHDTKRGEDARARLLALSELPADWTKLVKAWGELNARFARARGAARVPSRAHEYMLYQALLGAWPLEGYDQGFVERMQAYALKAAREGKEQTSWIAPDQDYENGLGDFIGRILDPDQSGDFIGSFDAFTRRAALIGALNSLTQVALKATIPGVPDFYQGTELWDLSLVDPDNRRAVDLAARARALQSVSEAPDWSALARAWPDGRIKLTLTARILSMRRAFANVFSNGEYRPLEVKGRDRAETLAFARCHGPDAVIVIVGRLFGRPSQGGRRWPPPDAWEAAISFGDLSGVRNLLTGRPAPTGPELPILELFEAIPVALLQARRM